MGAVRGIPEGYPEPRTRPIGLRDDVVLVDPAAATRVM